VTGAIAAIELQRQAAEQEAGVPAACAAALRKLHELLDRERQSLRRRPKAGHSRNVEAVTSAIERTKAWAGVTTQGPGRKNAFLQQRNASWRNAQRSPARNKGRRTMGRAGGR
jgi:hypothetical protein